MEHYITYCPARGEEFGMKRGKFTFEDKKTPPKGCRNLAFTAGSRSEIRYLRAGTAFEGFQGFIEAGYYRPGTAVPEEPEGCSYLGAH